mmetsp:Transcript_13476/g.42440  ORF Transcript_13476/g.42440 Transcript_13476/m.42440 type:complete len:219 (+) Transcript_13476:237-893(+)
MISEPFLVTRFNAASLQLAPESPPDRDALTFVTEKIRRQTTKSAPKETVIKPIARPIVTPAVDAPKSALRKADRFGSKIPTKKTITTTTAASGHFAAARTLPTLVSCFAVMERYQNAWSETMMKNAATPSPLIWRTAMRAARLEHQAPDRPRAPEKMLENERTSIVLAMPRATSRFPARIRFARIAAYTMNVKIPTSNVITKDVEQPPRPSPKLSIIR